MPSLIEVTAVTSRSDRQRFLDLPWSIYRSNPNWVPLLAKFLALVAVIVLGSMFGSF